MTLRRVVEALIGFGSRDVLLKLALFGAIVSGLLYTDRVQWTLPAARLGDGHAIAALELAMNRAFCSAPSAVSPQHRIPHHLRDTPADANKPLRQLASDAAGSLEAYCRSATSPFINNENSLTVVEAGLLSLEPTLSLDGLGQRLHQLRVGMLLVFSIACIISGLSVIAAVAVLLVSGSVLSALWASQHTVFPFLLPAVLITIAGYSLCWPLLRAASWVHLIAVGAAGAVTAVIVNLRTSYYPVCLTMALIALVFAVREWQLTRARLVMRVAVAAVVFGGAFWLVQYVSIGRFLASGDSQNPSYHPISHSLVLSLANPENALSRREGIEWLDAAGLRIAQRIDPQVEYLGPGYERALFIYYQRLWRAEPGQMLAVYATKFNTTGVAIIKAMREGQFRGRLMQPALAPWALVRSGWVLVVVSLAVAAVAYGGGRARHGSFPLLLALLAAAGSLLLTESAIIMPAYNPQYHGFLMTYFPLLSIFVWQGVLQTLLRRAGWSNTVGVTP